MLLLTTAFAHGCGHHLSLGISVGRISFRVHKMQKASLIYLKSCVLEIQNVHCFNFTALQLRSSVCQRKFSSIRNQEDASPSDDTYLFTFYNDTHILKYWSHIYEVCCLTPLPGPYYAFPDIPRLCDKGITRCVTEVHNAQDSISVVFYRE